MRVLLSRIKAFLDVFLSKKEAPSIRPELINRLSHELRTSLTGIVGYAEFLEAGSQDPMMNFTAKIIRESGRSLTRTSQSFFDLYLLTQQKLNLNSSPFVLSELTQNVVNKCQELAVERDINLVLEASDRAIGVILFSDAVRVHQVLEALIYSLLQASERWSLIRVQLEFNQVRQWLDVSFVSSGATASSVQNDLYKQFWNADDYRLRLQEGPGVELVLAKALIHFLNGLVWFESSDACPFRLVVRFPLNLNLSKASYE
jgi:signal transduction histidine kinase